MKQLIKKTIGGFLLILAFGGVVLAAFGGKTPVNTEITRIAPTPTFEKLPPPANNNHTLGQENLTLGVTKALAKEIVASNPNGPVLSDSGSQITALDPDTLVKDAIANGLENFNPDTLREIVIENNLHVVNTIEKSAQEEYFRNFYTIYERDLGSQKIDQQNPEKTDFGALAKAYATAQQDFYTLSVPTPLLPYHKKEIAILGAQKNAFNLISNYQSDPVQAFLALQILESFTKEMTDLITTLDSYIVKNNLTL